MSQYLNQTPLVNAGDILGPIQLAQDKSCGVSIQTGVNNPAGAVLVLEATLDLVQWFTLACTDPADGVTVKTSYTGVGKAGVCPLNAASLKAVRIRRTDGTGGNATATLGISQA